ncbi:MAG: CHAT domain-containing protein, partial [Planctomycetota bacterium]
ESRLAATGPLGRLFAAPLELPQVQRSLRADEALVEYFTAGDELLAFVVTPRSSGHVRRLAAIGDVNEAAENLHFQLRRVLSAGAQAARSNARLAQEARLDLQELYELVMAPLSALVAEASHLVVVPHGPLHTVPFHALFDGDRHLIQRHQVSVLPSASLGAHLSRGDGSVSPAATGELIVGFADHAAPLIDEEVSQVAAVLGDPVVLQGPHATVERFQDAASRARVLHMSCHGRFVSSDAHVSGLRLADRWLTVRDLYGTRLPGSLVVLSGCETGRAVTSAADDLVGLQQGFLAAGASALILSGWTVDDDSTLFFMRELYRGFHGTSGPIDLGAVVREAQIATMDLDAHPVFWGAFALVGRRMLR